jgi:dCTP deaminase
LDRIEEARIWDIAEYREHQSDCGAGRPELRVAKYNLAKFSGRYLRSPPDFDETSIELVQKRLKQVVVRPGGFVLWTTKERVGTPSENAGLICFVDGKSTKARAGILVHLTAPTIHSTWAGKITLEIANLGPFDLVLQEDDVIAQIVVARITTAPERGMKGISATFEQTGVDGLST